ncbi:transposase [Thermosynechococcus sp. HN-54]|uniref:RNA-guided endonuclease InsQ/TnpB family protein n=1 Tax=Thermosynechococcus sp. HN-54 TaxID=2933959 RepID=UPI0028F3EBB6|nr:transposase [Thermosynechococcus sp. HN-54]
MNKHRLQAETYKAVRAQFGLTANLTVRACARVAANRKVGKPVKFFQPTSADYDARLFDYREKEQCVSLSTLDARERIPLTLGDYQMSKLQGKKPTSATLCRRRDRTFHLHIPVKEEVPDPKPGKDVIGVDLGRRDIAVTSTGESWEGKPLSQARDKFARVRASLQRKGTKGAKRLLKRLSGREKRYQQWVNHNISKSIIAQAKATGCSLAVEDLTSIRERTNQKPRSKTERRRSNSWAAFYQLRQFLAYKGLRAGVEVISVSPRYPSQICAGCLHIGSRNHKHFKCNNPQCAKYNQLVDTDLNGAMMIRLVGGADCKPACDAQLAVLFSTRQNNRLGQKPAFLRRR